eukprot:m.195910 g.195910  ORF g.195910 m.195910 type:complete len:117 (-) comp53732_c1_seq20:131-481(-)
MRGHAEALALIEEHEQRLAGQRYIKAAPVTLFPITRLRAQSTSAIYWRNTPLSLWLRELMSLLIVSVTFLRALICKRGTAELGIAEVQEHSERQEPATSMPAMQLALTGADFELAE